MEDILHKIETLEDCGEVVVGFDAFIDHIVRPLKQISNPKEAFETSQSFAEFLKKQEERSCSVELQEQTIKIGGNNPIMSHALGELGVKVQSIGAYGEKEVDSAFRMMSKNCHMIPIGAPGRCFALEFETNKTMLYTNSIAEHISYSWIEERITQEKLINIYENAKLIVLVNYSEMPRVLEVWKGLLEFVLPNLSQPKNFFFDLSDCSKVQHQELEEMCQVIKEFKVYGEVYLSINDNEFFYLAEALISDNKREEVNEADDNLRKIVQLSTCLEVDGLVVRRLDKFYGVKGDEVYQVFNQVIKNPKVLTGAGDNQNAGICIGLLMGLSLRECMILGSKVGNFYIQQGYSPNREALKKYLAEQID